MTALDASARNECVRAGERCTVHDGHFPTVAKTCWGDRPGPTPHLALPLVASGPLKGPAALELHALAEPEALRCEGSNHVPECHHFRAPAAPPPAAGVSTTPTRSSRPRRAAASVVETARDAATPELGVPPASIAPASGATLAEIPLELVDIGPNVRVTLDAMDELAASIAEHGILQPVKATLMPDGRYRLLWGQRRVLAARQAGLATIPALVERGGDIVERPIEQLVENLHRADLNPIDRAQAMRAVVDSGISQADLARKLGIAPSTVSNDLRILTLDEKVVEKIRDGAITASHGKAIASLPAKQQGELARSIVERGLSSHGLETELKWRQDEAANDKARAERTVKWIPKAIAALEAAGVPKDVEIHLSGNSYNVDHGAIAKEIRAAGWTNFSSQYHPARPANGKCDCSAVRLDVGGRKAEVVGVCSDQRHQDRAQNVDHRLEEEARKAYEARKVAVQREIERQLRASGLHPLVLELLDKAIGAYHDGRTGAERDVVAGLALAIVQTWRVREAITPELVGELGLADPPEAAS